MRGLRLQALSQLLLIAIAMIIPGSQQNDGTHKSDPWSQNLCGQLEIYGQTNKLQLTAPHLWWEIQSLTGCLNCTPVFSIFSPHKNDIWTFQNVIAWRKLRCRKSSQCRSAVVIVVPLFFQGKSLISNERQIDASQNTPTRAFYYIYSDEKSHLFVLWGWLMCHTLT